MKAPQIRMASIRSVHHKLTDRIFAVPKLQREFVWDGGKAAALLDSIFKRMPVGTLLVWETRPQNYDLLRQSLHILPPFDPENPFGWFLVDGQQRLSVIHEAFAGGVRTNSSGRSIDFGRLCFVLEPSDDGDCPPRFAYRKPVPRRFIPIQDILSDSWHRRNKGATKSLFKKISECRRRILNYKLPIITMQSTDLEEVREVFLRINSQGMKISAADRAFARASKVDLRHLAHELRAGVRPEFHDIDFNAILQGFSFITPERELDVGQRSLEASISWWEKKIENDGQDSMFYDRWRAFRTAFQKAVDYVYEHFHVLHSGFLPSVNMLATLSVFFYDHPAAPNAHQAREIRKWFWSTGVGKRYSGRGHRQNQLSDVRFFQRLASTGRASFTFIDRVDPLEIARTEYTQQSAIANAYLCLLASNRPCYIANGRPIPATIFASRANRSDRHHIFPRQLLANNGLRHRDYNSLCNICLIVAEENQRFGAKRPDRYLAEHLDRKHFSRAMRSHLIPYDSNSGLWIKGVAKAYKRFSSDRLKEICRAFEKQADMKLFR